MVQSGLKTTFGTFGIYRWLMALFVALNHLAPRDFMQCGPYAVYGFFVLSGYIVSYILCEHYLLTDSGIAKYYVNRALRVYPTYLVVLLFSVLVVVLFPETARKVHGFMEIPGNAYDWIINCGVFGITSQWGVLRGHVLVPTAWSLAVELQWWLLIPLFMQDKSYLRFFFIFTVLYATLMLVSQQLNLSMGDRVFSPFTASLPFAIGMLLYLRKQKGFSDMSHGVGLTAIVLLAAYFIFAMHLDNGWRGSKGLYTDVVLQAGVVYYLSGIDASILPRSFARIDSILGNLSYPIFLLNILAAVIARLVFPTLERNSWGLFCLGFLLCNILAIILFYGIEVPVNRLRKRIKT